MCLNFCIIMSVLFDKTVAMTVPPPYPCRMKKTNLKRLEFIIIVMYICINSTHNDERLIQRFAESIKMAAFCKHFYNMYDILNLLLLTEFKLTANVMSHILVCFWLFYC